MGNISRRKSSQTLKELSNEQLENLLNNTSFDKDQILDWHNGFLVIDIQWNILDCNMTTHNNL